MRRRNRFSGSILQPVRLMSLLTMAFVGAWSTTALAQQERPEDAAVQREQDDELTRRLIREATGGAQEGVMERTMRLMDEAHTRLAVRFDPGVETQILQQQVLDQLDSAIAQAAANRSQRRSSRQVQVAADKRMLPKPKRAKADAKKSADDTSSTQTTTSDGASESTGLTRSGLQLPLRETRRGWGHLPRRDREELIQGIDSEFLDKYRTLIERYYRALAKAEDE
ncbi:MAG: hypothetical protein IID37_04935 [Planctomycetes bacterium]|nr:hypothetical protein [Planctomycetota bacterium]